MDPATCSSIYLHGLVDTAKLVDQAVKDDTNRTRRKHVREYMDWMGNLQLPKSMQTVTPEDLSVYSTGFPGTQAPVWAKANLALPQAAWQESDPTCPQSLNC